MILLLSPFCYSFVRVMRRTSGFTNARSCPRGHDRARGRVQTRSSHWRRRSSASRRSQRKSSNRSLFSIDTQPPFPSSSLWPRGDRDDHPAGKAGRELCAVTQATVLLPDFGYLSLEGHAQDRSPAPKTLWRLGFHPSFRRAVRRNLPWKRVSLHDGSIQDHSPFFETAFFPRNSEHDIAEPSCSARLERFTACRVMGALA